MTERPLPKPEHLRDVPSSRKEWLAQRPWALVALALGLISFIVVATSQDQMWATPDWRISCPGFALTAIAALVSLAKRERGHVLWLVGLGLAGAALVLGWFVMLAIVIGVTLVLMLILSTVM
ncbi:MAG TPA: hypothetical protein VIV11_27185 [Kofleriaceae bacterium]